ncbi:methionine synthase reductase-like [Harmonia axyridis]|uniref:methionine synthase reductase-like n=1 Tax=Harmonia axyridis TaxID=115357 RepID=UPI001E277536|nr:methionine synthase reductase-like [Harmonia axyridis]
MGKYLKLSYDISSHEIPTTKVPEFQYRVTPFPASDLINISICNCELITNEKNRKVYYLKFSRENINFHYEPGYTIGILPSNSIELVNRILIRLGLEDVADQCYKLSLDESATKKLIPKHLPVYGTLRNLLLHNVDLTSAPKKLFLKSLLEYTTDEKECDTLLFLCSPKGSIEYQTLISSYTKRSVLGLLEMFPSCQPPIEVLLKHLPPLLPRAYSISSSPLNEEYLSITFNVDTFPDNQRGLCTSWLERCIHEYEKTKHVEVPIYLRNPSSFVLPEDNSVPIILIGTGTGISPFRGFLEHRHLNIAGGASYGKSWLFYGCRDSNRNYLFKSDLKEYLASGALSRLCESFSRESETNKYVQHEIEKYTEELGTWIVKDNAIVYVCGDFLRILPAVKEAVLKVLVESQDFPENDAQLYLKEMEEKGRYIVDNWN